MNRFKDPGESIYAFMDETFVVCPACSGCALSRQIDPKQDAGWFGKRRLTCLRCGRTQEWAKREIARGWYNLRDDYFGLPLWLQTPCCGKVLWAYNERHLDLIEKFIGADLREKGPADPNRVSWHDQDLTSSLPAWMKSAKNRAGVVKAAAFLRSKLPA